MSHDELFVNQVINSGGATASSSAPNSTGVGSGRGELWVLSKKRLKRFDGTFGDYKKIVAKRVMRGEDF